MNNLEINLSISHSNDIKELVTALAKAQGVLKPAVYNRQNPHFKSRYADFASCMDACRAPLSDNGIAIVQYCATIGGKLSLVTMLAHASGQWMKSEFPLISAKMDSQGIGSAMTYAKRYSLCGMVGIVADEDIADDDAEYAQGRGKQRYEKPKPAAKPIETKSENFSPRNSLKDLLEKEGYPVDQFEQVIFGLAAKKDTTEERIIASALLPDVIERFKEAYLAAYPKQNEQVA